MWRTLWILHFGNLFFCLFVFFLIRSYFSLPHLLITGAISMSKRGKNPTLFCSSAFFWSLCRDSHSAAGVRLKEYRGRSLVVRTSVRIIAGEFWFLRVDSWCEELGQVTFLGSRPAWTGFSQLCSGLRQNSISEAGKKWASKLCMSRIKTNRDREGAKGHIESQMFAEESTPLREHLEPSQTTRR